MNDLTHCFDFVLIVVTTPTFRDAHKHPEETPKQGILYCFARKMKNVQAHEFSALKYNGGFNYEHGAYLECTYPPCRKNGIKYRYCKPCHKGMFYCFLLEY